MNFIQNITSEQALEILKPNSELNRNPTTFMFYDSSDNNKLKGIFFDDAIESNKVIREFSGGQEPKRYKALLTQIGEEAPTEEILINEIGDIVWSRTGVGTYMATLIGAFKDGKTATFNGNKPNSAFINFQKISEDQIILVVEKFISPVFMLTDDRLTSVVVSIEVYQ